MCAISIPFGSRRSEALRAICGVAVLALSACGTSRPPSLRGTEPTVGPGTPSASIPQPPTPNLVIAEEEVVQNEGEDGISAAEVYVDGALVGRIPSGRRSQPRRWQGRVEPGNHLVRIVRWTLPGVADWIRPEEEQQPRERFVRVDPGQWTKVLIRYSDRGRKVGFEVSRHPEGEGDASQMP